MDDRSLGRALELARGKRVEETREIDPDAATAFARALQESSTRSIDGRGGDRGNESGTAAEAPTTPVEVDETVDSETSPSQGALRHLALELSDILEGEPGTSDEVVPGKPGEIGSEPVSVIERLATDELPLEGDFDADSARDFADDRETGEGLSARADDDVAGVETEAAALQRRALSEGERSGGPDVLTRSAEARAADPFVGASASASLPGGVPWTLDPGGHVVVGSPARPVDSVSLAALLSRLRQGPGASPGRWQIRVVNGESGLETLELSTSPQGGWELKVGWSAGNQQRVGARATQLREALHERGHVIDRLEVADAAPEWLLLGRETS